MKLAIIILTGSILAGPVFGQNKGQSETQKRIAAAKEQVALMEEQIALMQDPANCEAKVYEGNNDERRVQVYRLSLKVPAKAASRGVKARKAATVVVEHKIEIKHHVATTLRRQAQIEAAELGADLSDAAKIDREVYKSSSYINGDADEVTIQYYAGTKLVASRDIFAGDMQESRAIVDRMLKFDVWARAMANKK